MASKYEDAFYWEASSGFSFKFDDELDIKKEKHIETLEDDKEFIFNSTLETSNTLPLRALICHTSLELVLHDVKLPMTTSIPPVEDPIRKMFHGEAFSLHYYRTLDEKILLLDKAIETYDGNIILKVVLFLSKTLKPSIFYRYLIKRQIALQHFVNYLINSNRAHDLETLSMSTGIKAHIPYLFYLSSKTTSVNNIKKKLDKFCLDYLDNLKDNYEKLIFKEHKKFIQYKMDNNLLGDNPIEVLAELCNKKLSQNESPTDSVVIEYVKSMKISDFQMEWVLCNVISANEKWNKINDIFIKPNWLRKNVIKSNVNLELLIFTLYKHNAPKNVLQQFLSSMVDVERSIYLGKKLKCHQFVIDALILKRDRLGLILYKSHVIMQSEFMISIENALASDKKWIN